MVNEVVIRKQAEIPCEFAGVAQEFPVGVRVFVNAAVGLSMLRLGQGKIVKPAYMNRRFNSEKTV